MTLTATDVQREILAAYKQKYPKNIYSPWGDLDGFEVPGLGEIKQVDYRTYGDEDCTGRVEVIFELGGRFFLKSGMYYSHVGTEWDDYTDLVEVKKTTVTKTVTVTFWDGV